MRLALRFMLLSLTASSNVVYAQSAATPAPKPNPIVGKWRYFNNHIVTITADGRLASSNGSTGAWEFSNNKEVERKYKLTWNGGVFIDALVMSRDGNHLVGKNQKGEKISADRVAP